jgi:hypothetical protein
MPGEISRTGDQARRRRGPHDEGEVVVAQLRDGLKAGSRQLPSR